MMKFYVRENMFTFSSLIVNREFRVRLHQALIQDNVLGQMYEIAWTWSGFLRILDWKLRVTLQRWLKHQSNAMFIQILEIAH